MTATTRSRSASRSREIRAGSDEELLSPTGSVEGKDGDNLKVNRKRHREGSTEPSAGTTSTTAPLAAKKNRIEPPSDARSEGSTSPVEGESGMTSHHEESIDETRKKVEDLSHEETQKSSSKLLTVQEEESSDRIERSAKESVDAETVETGQKRKMISRAPSANKIDHGIVKRVREDEAEESPSVETSAIRETAPTDTTEKGTVESNVPTPSAVPATPTKKPQATFGSFSSAASPFASVKPSDTGLSGSSSTSSELLAIAAKVRAANGVPPADTPGTPAASSTLPVKKAQATFGAFSASASPFSAVKHTSAFTSQPVASSSNATGHHPSPFKTASGSSSVFGGWSSGAIASPFATPLKKNTASAENADQEEDKKEVEAEAKSSTSFGDILTNSGAGPAIERTTVELEAQDTHTGEEDEDTVYQARIKLFVMDDKGTWRERGTGQLRINVDKKRSGTAPRLVMRAEGVLRLILNVSMFPKMTFELSEKHIRTVVFEDGKAKSLAIRAGNAKTASDLHAKLTEFTPKEAVKPEAK